MVWKGRTVSSTNWIIRDRLLDGLFRYRLPRPAASVYVALLEFGPHTEQALLRRRVVAVEELAQALKVLREVLLLIGEQRYRGKVRYYATNPRIAWRWQEFRFIWDRVLTLVPVDEVPLLQDMRDQERLEMLRAIRADAVALFDQRRHSLVEDGRGRVLADEGEYAQACAEVISLAEREIIAIDQPPYMTATLPVFWSAITDRRAAGVTYRRYVPIEEILLHGLDVVARDIDEVGVDLQVINPATIRQRFYLVDDKFLLIKFANGSTSGSVAMLSHDRHKIQRYREWTAQAVATALPASEVLPSARRWAASLAHAAGRRFASDSHERVTHEIARMGKFAEFEPEHLPCIRDLLAEGFIEQVEPERYALAPPIDRAFSTLASLR